ncbi:PREDICTED: ribonuclease ZC3H12A-like isoform X2 [Polistes dominula]|uniref:Ribonuclease ZC3H12A-like isoform X2 n=1 Tax=Polistes dominula TaxID=743375 RepID=A0ABM1IML9_POLDO|nr:PREDICTED: ribonuclease ZC3H12A-like isoform X2 [Polistes dominula]
MTVAGKRYVDCTVLSRSNNGGDAEDSSYDSDYEAEDSTNVHPPLESRLSSSTHSDVSRTTSDTLAAEFAEYVTVQGHTPTQSPGYTARVEFALKLGYTERLVQAALQKLGPDPGQNELLAELIKLGASCSPKLSESLDESDNLFDGESSNEEFGGRSNLTTTTTCLRPVVIDGSNVAMSHGNKEVFSCRGIKICVDWFKARGHREITVFVPKWRKEASRPDNPIADQEILGELERDRLLVFTPSRLVGGKRMVCYDDRYILKLAAEEDGIVVSNDNYRDLAQENPEFRRVVEERILMYSFVNDRFMPPDDPLGRSGPTLENFLRIGPKKTDPAPPCPYAKKCTYGNKCKFRHPERGPHPHKSVTERLVEHAQRHLQARGPSLSLPLNSSTPTTNVTTQHQPLCKARSVAVSSNVSQSLSSVPKSRSVENVTTDLSTTSPIVYAQQISAVQNMQGYVSPATWATPRVNNSDGEPVNMHRKLQRQLTLNPACDPRLYQLRRYQQHTAPSSKQQQQQQQQQPQQQQKHSQQSIIGGHPTIQHRPLTRHASNESPYSVPISWDHPEGLHQHVTRIASAPDSYRAWPPRSTNLVTPSRVSRLGTSDPQLNLLPSPSSVSTNLHGGVWNTQTQDARRHLHYHLANIFPEEQVQAAMAMNPHETDPQQICATILAMFPKN